MEVKQHNASKTYFLWFIPHIKKANPHSQAFLRSGNKVKDRLSVWPTFNPRTKGRYLID